MDESTRIVSGALPRTFGKYTLLRELGHGGMGVVFEAAETGRDERLALKLMLPGSSGDSPEAAYFTREGRISARIPPHPNIVRVLEAGTVEGQPFIAMSYLDGRPLAKVPSKGLEDFKERVRLLRDVALAVHHAHEHGVLHRDLSPRNVMVDAAGRPWVTDFGMAKRYGVDRGISSTDAGTVVGTPSFMSPEQAQGLKEIDRRTDVYGLGAILYDMITGKPPFPGDQTIIALLRVVQDPILPPSSASSSWAASSYDKSIEAVCMKALSKSPQQRHPTARAFADDLSRWLGEMPAKKPGGCAAVVLIAAALLLAAAAGVRLATA